MNILIVGAGKGSWIMRGRQLGAALGARVTSTPTSADFEWASVVILVKRAGAAHAAEAHRRGLPVVWDALDFWRQPDENHSSPAYALLLLRAQLDVIRPTLTIGATEAMATAAAGVCVPHHTWNGLAPTPAREMVRTVAYEGSPLYLGRWHGWLEDACQRRGWAFVVNPPDLSVVDVLVAFRDGPWDGWICREWKSGVKVGNAIAAGRPLISQDCAAVRELKPVGSVIESVEELADQLDLWALKASRDAAVDRSRDAAPGFSLSVIAERYRQVLAERGLACTT